MKKWKTQFLAAALAAVASMPSAPWESGVYQDKAAGYGGDVILTVTIRDGRIRTLETENTGGEQSEYYLKAEQARKGARAIASSGEACLVMVSLNLKTAR